MIIVLKCSCNYLFTTLDEHLEVDPTSSQRQGSFTKFLFTSLQVKSEYLNEIHKYSDLIAGIEKQRVTCFHHLTYHLKVHGNRTVPRHESELFTEILQPVMII